LNGAVVDGVEASINWFGETSWFMLCCIIPSPYCTNLC